MFAIDKLADELKVKDVSVSIFPVTLKVVD